MNNSNIKTAVFWVVIIMVVVLFWTVVHNTKSRQDVQLSYTALMNDVNAGKIKTVKITGNDLQGTYKEDNQELRAVIPTNHQNLDDAMLQKGVDIHYNTETGSGWVNILVNAIPFVLVLAFWIFMMRQMQSGGNKAFELRKEPRPAAFLPAKESYFQGRSWSRGSQGRAPGDHRVPARTSKISEIRRPYSQRRLAGRTSRYW